MNTDYNSLQKQLFMEYYAEIIPVVLGLRENGYSTPAIAAELNLRGYLTREKKPFSPVHVLRILQRSNDADSAQPGAHNSMQSVTLDSQLQGEVDQLKNEICMLQRQYVELLQKFGQMESQLSELKKENQLQKGSYVEITVDSQNDPVEPVAALSKEKPIEPAPNSRKPARTVGSEIKKVVLQQANQLHVENSDLTKSHIAKVLSERFDIRFETVRDWLKKLW
jgi:hypothetical protein